MVGVLLRVYIMGGFRWDDCNANMSIHLTLSVYRARVNTIYNKLLDNDIERANLLFERYANERDVIKVLPPQLDENIQYGVFVADIFLTARLITESKMKLRSVMEMIDSYSLQQAMMIQRLSSMYESTVLERDALGALYQLPFDCLCIIAQEVQMALVDCN